MFSLSEFLLEQMFLNGECFESPSRLKRQGSANNGGRDGNLVVYLEVGFN